jgi:hypothetical protein
MKGQTQRRWSKLKVAKDTSTSGYYSNIFINYDYYPSYLSGFTNPPGTHPYPSPVAILLKIE